MEGASLAVSQYQERKASLIFGIGQEPHPGILTLLCSFVLEYWKWPLAVEEGVKRVHENTSADKYVYSVSETRHIGEGFIYSPVMPPVVVARGYLVNSLSGLCPESHGR